MRIKARADRRSADRKVKEAGHDEPQALNVAIDEIRPTAEFLADRNGRCILQMRAADLNDTLELFRLCLDRRAYLLNLRKKRVDPLRRGDVHRGRERVV